MIMSINITKKTGTANTTVSKGRKILYIVEHYTAGVTSKSGSAANTAAYFAKDTTQASADFIVDDANIVQYNPDPANRYCWAVGGNNYGNKGGSLYGVAKNANSISIEICSTNSAGKITTPNDSKYSFTDAVVAKAVELTKYLMETYGIDADHVIRHYDVNGKPCPGIIGWNAESGDESKWKAFKAKLNTSTTTSTATTTNTGTTDEQKIWNFLKTKIGNEYGAAGLMGNLYAESALKPNNLQNTHEKSLGMTDAEYTAAVDNGSYTNFVKDSAGYGLAQWTYYSRKQNLLDYAKSVSKSIGDLDMQLDFLWKELQGYTSVLNTLKSAKTVLEASNIVLTKFEAPADTGATVQTKRCGYGQTYYNKYATETSAASTSVTYRVRKTWADASSQKGAFTVLANAKACADSNPGYSVFDESGKAVYTSASAASTTATSSTPYQVRVKVADLNIRKGAGMNYAKLGKYTGKGVFTIVEEKQGTIDTKGTIGTWGLLKSYQTKKDGWICLAYPDYTEKV